MKPAVGLKKFEIGIQDLLNEADGYKKNWLAQESKLSEIKTKEGIRLSESDRKKISDTKKEIFNLMKNEIDQLKNSEISQKQITIYKKEDYKKENQISISGAKRKPKVISEKIEWKGEDSDNEMVFQVNFANPNYGGGTFGEGFVQEEIKNVLSTTASILTANKEQLNLNPRSRDDKPTPVVIVGQIKDFDNIDLPYGWNDNKWENPTNKMIKRSDKPEVFNELAIAANRLNGDYGNDTAESVKTLFNNALAGFHLAKNVAGNKNCKIKTGLFGAGAFRNSPEFSIAMQYLASRIANVEIEFCGINKDPRSINTIFDRVDEMISSGMSLESIANHLITNWKSKIGVDSEGWKKGGIDIPTLDESVSLNKTPSTSFVVRGKPSRLTQNSLNPNIINALKDYAEGKNSSENLKDLKTKINNSVANLGLQDQEFLKPKIYSGIGVKTKLIYDESNCQVKFQIAEVFEGGIAQNLEMKVGNTIVIEYQRGKDPKKVAREAICAIRNLSVENLKISYEGNERLNSRLKSDLGRQDSGDLFHNNSVINDFDQNKARNIISNLPSARGR